ncbi:MAG: hypothetical protein KJ583_02545 [Nanoarchaeota archaeon]|nr:hypothetical protein [Nanoarchaeota archaeon]MBU1269932.1 hypothetical protein [Nanoarchaeota archaeon]MBU1604173.1 hypothetical protein [Nanoarchaeota archaeon]MBU2443074.1 hypothetical protein [Nanoarchaeota archaeon]
MIKNKKGDISISVIIMIAIGLLVLIVIAILIFRSGQSASSGTSCISKGGVCKQTCEVGHAIGTAGMYGCNTETCCSPVKRDDWGT